MADLPPLNLFRDRKEEISDVPDLLETELDRLLWVLKTAAGLDEEHAYLTPFEATEILRELYRLDIPRQRAVGILDSARAEGLVHRKRRGGRDRFCIMKPGLDALDKQGVAAVFVDPEKALSEIRRFEDMLASLRGQIRICDPYLENKSLDYIACLSGAASVRFLTVNILKEARVRRDLTAFRNEHSIPVEICVSPKGKLHDRYIIHDDGMLLLGTSLNGFAKKQSFVVSVGEDIKAAIVPTFDKMWNAASVF